MKKQLLLFSSILLIAQFACSAKVFNVVDKTATYKGNKLAVIAGMNNKATIAMAKYLTQYLKENTNFSVISQSKITRSIRHYPVNIKGPYISAKGPIEEDYTLTDIKKLKHLNRRIRADYIYIVWVPVHVGMTTRHSTGYTNKGIPGPLTQDEIVNVINQFYKFPEGKQVANGKYMIRLPKEGYTYLPGQARWDSIYHLMREWCYGISVEVGKKTGMIKSKIEKFDREKYREKA